MSAERPPLRLDSAAGRGVVAAAILGSGAAFLESTVVNVALPAMARDLRLGIEGVQWILEGYFLSLGALMLLGGALGDAFDRGRVFAAGAAAFAVLSGLCALAPNVETLVALRLLQGAAGALLVPNSLAMLDTAFAAEDRGTAIGRWAGGSAVSTAVGPLLGGWLVDEVSWRWVFACVVPFAAGAVLLARRYAPPSSSRGRRSLDLPGAALATLGLAGLVVALVAGPRAGFGSPGILAAAAAGVAALVAFVAVERRSEAPLLPLELFRSRQFTGANLTTLLVYSAFGGTFLFLILQLQNVLGYSALQAGAALLPVNALMLALSPTAGRLSQRRGPRTPMVAGALLSAAGLALLTRVGEGDGYVEAVLPGVTVFGLGLTALVAPLTAAVLGAVPEEQAGVASAVNNATARLAGLLSTAALPLAAGVGGLEALGGPAFSAGYSRAMWLAAGLAAAGAAAAAFTIESGAPVTPVTHPSPTHGCTHRRRATAMRPTGRPGAA